MNDVLHQTFLGNRIENYCWLAGILLAGIVFKRLLSKAFSLFLYRFFKKYSSGFGGEKLFDLLKRPCELFVLLITLYFAFARITFPEEWKLVSREHLGLRMIIHRSFLVMLIVAFTWIILRIVDFFGLVFAHKASLTETKSDDQLVAFLRETIKIVIGIFSIFFILGSVFKLDITSLIAGLGIGGLAIALAAKESIENLLGSFTIFFDKPFLIGDSIKTDGVEGVVEMIGFRSTRIRTPDKSFVTVPNKLLVNGMVDNLSLRTGRKVQFTIPLSYSNSLVSLKAIITEIEKILAAHPKIDHATSQITLFELNANGVNLKVVFFVLGNNASDYLNSRQEVNLLILDSINKNGGVVSTPPSK